MISLIIFLAVLISGGMFGATYGKRFEECVPVQMLGIIIVLYLWGIVGMLKAGVYFALIASVLLTAFSAVRVLSTSGGKHVFIKSFLTPGFFLFVLLYLGLIYFNVGRVAYYWDEFSHWIDSVKVTSIYDSFIIIPETDSAYKSYPPGITLFQYFFQKLYELGEQRDFSEWRCYVAYQLFGLSMFFPCFKRIKEFNIVQILLYGTTLVILPLLFYYNYYSYILVDPLVGILAGSAFFILLTEEKNGFTLLHICMLCTVLVLLKDIGVLFAFFVGVAYFFSDVLCGSKLKHAGKLYYLRQGCPVYISMITWLSWKGLLKYYKTPIRYGSVHIDLAEYTRLFFSGSAIQSQEQTIVSSYKHAFFEDKFRFVNNDTEISCAIIFATLLVLSYIIARRLSSLQKTNRKKNDIIWLLMVLLTILYMYSMGALYIYSFSKYESSVLASYARYLGMPFCMIWTVIIWGAIRWSEDALQGAPYYNLMVLLTVFILIVSPLWKFRSFVNGETRAYSLQNRSRYTGVHNLIMKHCGKDDHIYFLSQEDGGQDILHVAFLIRPYHLGGDWSIGPQFYEDDVSTRNVSADEFKNDLYQNYEYLVIYHLNNYFVDTYGDLFEDEEKIEECALYKVDKSRGESGLLLCFVANGEAE